VVADVKQRIINYPTAKYFNQSDFDGLINTASFFDPRVKTKHLIDHDMIKQQVIEEGTVVLESGTIAD